MTWLAVAVAGAAGAVCRYGVDHLVTLRGHAFPWGTAVVNLSGSALLGLLSGLAAGQATAPAWLIVGASGFCGAYTTFSTWMVETVRLAEDGRGGAAAANLATLLAGVVLAAGGWWLGAVLA